MGVLKEQIAEAVQAAVVNNLTGRQFHFSSLPGVSGAENAIERSETSIISALQTRIRVRTKHGPRYFIVQLKEQL